MPYNTRRKSLSLPSLGIHLPVTHAARAAAHRATQNHCAQQHHRISSTNLLSSPSTSSPERHLNKKMKRSHSEDDQSAAQPARPAKLGGAVKLETTPPPSPKTRTSSVEMDTSDAPVVKTIDLDGINDEIVEAVIVRLQSTGNRPHLVKELAAILMKQLKIVQQSANPCAIISSRLATYLKRSCWSALARCPLAKELETVHPRRTYFYLTTCPHQPLPDPSISALMSRTIITPPSSTNSLGSEDADEERRRELSPSPEVDLSPEFDDLDDDLPMPTTPIGSFSGRFPLAGAGASRNHRSTSPPLEKDEKEFTQTAEGLQKRKLSGDMLSAEPVVVEMELDVDTSRDEGSLFGVVESKEGLGVPTQTTLVASPAIRPTFALNLKKDSEADSWAKLNGMLEWDRSPENIELDELEGLMDAY